MAPRLLFDRAFSDIDSCVDALDGWDAVFRQVGRGRLTARAAVLAGSRSAVMRMEFNRSLHQMGAASSGLLAFGLPDKPLRWCGVDADVGDVAGFSMPSGFEGASARGFSGYIVMCNETHLYEVACELGLDLDLSAATASAVWRSPNGEVDALRRRFAGAFDAVTRAGTAGPTATELLNYTAAAVLVNLFCNREMAKTAPDPTVRQRAVRKAVELLEDPLEMPLSVADLCRAVGVSAPTLYRAFQEEIGVSPKRYVQSRRLSGLRRELLEAPRGGRVSDLASRWGFWHMSQLAADYRRQFGELPSETLRRSQPASAS